jgi:urea transporter
MAEQTMFTRLQAILRGCGQTFFLPGPAFGAVLLAILLLNPRVAVAGFIAVAAAYLMARLIGMEQLFLQYGYYTYNPLLVGCSLGFKFEFGPAWLLLTVLSGGLTLGVTMLTAHLLVDKLRLPTLSVPYSLTACPIR